MKKLNKLACAAIMALGGLGLMAGSAQAVPIDVYAQANSSWGGIGLDTGIDLAIGEQLYVSVAPDDVWSAGPGDRTSNADGLAPGNLYGGVYPLYSQDGLDAYYGSLVGRIGAGDFFVLGTNFDAAVAAAGRLYLYYWDSNNGDNTGFVTANIRVGDATDVPEPATLGLLGVGLLGLVVLRRRKTA